MDIGNGQFVNCLRIALNNQGGLDFDMPQDGPLSGAGILWVLLDGKDIVEWVNMGSRFHDVGLSDVRNFTDTKTDERGIAQNVITGRGQPAKLSPAARPVEKKFKVQVRIQVDPPSIRGTFLSDAPGVLMGGLAAFPVELAQKTRFFASRPYTFPVKDWVDGLKVLIRGSHKYSGGNGVAVLDQYGGEGHLFLRADGSFEVTVPLSINTRDATGVCSDTGEGPGQLKLTGSLRERDSALVFTRVALSGEESFQGQCSGRSYREQPYAWSFALGKGEPMSVALKDGARLRMPPPSNFPWPGEWEMTLELSGDVLPMLE